MNDIFNQLMSGLNPSQSKVVNKIQGSVMVEAWPGSGKTHILAVRVANLLKSDAQVEPHNILCLTFTDAGSVAMRQRLLKFIGTTAYSVTISTFHAFCNDVIQNNIDYFGLRDMEPISRLEELQITENIIDSLSVGHPLKRLTGNVYFEVPRMLTLWNIMQREEWDDVFIKQKIEAFKLEMPLMEEYIYKRGNSKKGISAGDVNVNKINGIIEKMTTLGAAAELFPIYMSDMRKRNRYNFNDMISMTIDAFNNNENILLDYQERYQYVFLDENQDASGSQISVINKLMDYWDDPNILFVGDKKQSIYGFQGANIQNTKNLIAKYDPMVIPLNINYRSSQLIVDACNRVISQATDGTFSNETVVGMNDKPSEVKAYRYANFMQETAAIFTKIKSLVSEGVEPKKIAVIYRKHAHADELLELLYRHEIPVTTKRKINVMEEPIIRQILLILEYLISPERGEKSDIFFQILHFDFLGVNRAQIERLLVMLREGGTIADLDARSFKTVNGVIKLLADSEHIMHNGSILQLLQHIYYNTGMKDFIIGNKDKRKGAALKTLFNFVKEENERNGNMDVESLLGHVSRMKSNNVSVQIEDLISAESGVFFTTAHGSKGLEFEYVFLMRSNRSDWEKARAANNMYYIPENITYSVGDDKLEEARRLFFVAMSRAETHLYMSCSLKDDKGKDMEPSVFLLDAAIPVETVDESDVFMEVIESMTPTVLRFEPNVEAEKIDAILNDFRMSPSSLNQYMKCPLSFYYERILSVPYVQSYPAVYGSACHHAINKARIDKSVNTIETFVDEAVGYVNRRGVHLSNKERGRMVKAVKNILPDFYNKFMLIKKFVKSEFKVRDVVINEVPVYGEIDEVEMSDNIVVTDFKTGKPTTVKPKMEPPKNDEDKGGDIWRQLVFYKLLLQSNPKKPIIANELQVVTIGSEPSCIPLDYDRSHDVIVKEQIKSAYKSIMNKEFNGCGEPDCKWCSIVK